MTRKLYYSGPLVEAICSGGLTANAYGLAKLDAGVEPENALRSLLKYCFGPFYTKREAFNVARYQGASGAILEFELKMEV